MVQWMSGCGRAWIQIGAGVYVLALGACSHTVAERTVIAQNSENAAALAENVRALSDAAQASARVECEVMVRRARELVSRDLVRLRASVMPSDPSDAQVSPSDAEWVMTLRREVDALAARIAIASVDARPAVARSLADDHPAAIDLAMGTPGFSISRVLRDAVELDRVNQAIDAEPSAMVRSAQLVRRDAILDGYLPVRLAVEASGRYRDSLEHYLTTVRDQAETAGLHARSLAQAAAGNDARGAAAGILGDRDVRAAVLGIVSRQWGTAVAADIADRIERARRALEPLGN
jgi:hypothetical protein